MIKAQSQRLISDSQGSNKGSAHVVMTPEHCLLRKPARQIGPSSAAISFCQPAAAMETNEQLCS